MKDIHELDNKTLWDISHNEDFSTLLYLSFVLFLVSIGYLFIKIWYKIK